MLYKNFTSNPVRTLLGRGTAVTATALLAYFGKNEPAEYIEDHTTDAFVCKTEVDWMQFLFGLISKTSTVLMIYDTEGMNG